jgi:hypothetical protein
MIMRLNSEPHSRALCRLIVLLLVAGCAGRPVAQPIAETAGVEQAPRAGADRVGHEQAPRAGAGTAGVEQALHAGIEDAQALRQRAAEYWEARMKRDYCLQLKLSELRLQGRLTCEEYARGKGAIQYLGYDVGDAEIKGSFANVQVKVIARITLPGSQAKPVVKTATVPDAWIKVEGVWYRRADQGEGSPATPGAIQRKE